MPAGELDGVRVGGDQHALDVFGSDVMPSGQVDGHLRGALVQQPGRIGGGGGGGGGV